jgi:6,7-dimethyl-8-ribityllumazine synthase
VSDAPHIMIVESPYYEEINNNMVESVVIELDQAGATYERFGQLRASRRDKDGDRIL